MHKMKLKVYALFLFFTIHFLISCSNEVPLIISQNVFLVFDFSDKTEVVQRLSVYVQDNDVERIKELRIDYTPENLSWIAMDPVRRSISSGEWVGSSQFVMQGSRSFPVGEYSVQITNFTGNSTAGSFILDYPLSLINENQILNLTSIEEKYSDLDHFYSILRTSNGEIRYFLPGKITNQEIDSARQEDSDISSVQYYIESSKMSYAVLLPPEPLP